jgi:putative membrane protein
MAEAEEVRSLLLERRDQLRSGEPPSGAAAPEQGAAPAPERELARLDLGLLARSTILSFEMMLFTAGVAATAGAMVATGSAAASVGLALPALLGGGIALFRQVNANHGHVVTDTPAGLVLRRGLLSRSRQTVALPRVQGVRISEPLLWRPFGWARLEVSVAGQRAGEQQSLTTSVLMPVAPRPQVLALAEHALRGLDVDAVSMVGVPRQARWRAPVSHRWQALGATTAMVVSRRGFLNRRTDAVPTTRVQSLGLVQGPWSRRLGLADLEVHSPVGSVRVVGRFRGQEDARAFLEQLAVDTRAARLAGERAEPGAV